MNTEQGTTDEKMQVSKHTPFPWTMVVAKGSKSGKYEGNYEIAEAMEGEHAGNLRLIESIADLLAALETAHDAMCQATFIVKRQKSDLNHAIKVARKALAKSKGATQ